MSTTAVKGRQQAGFEPQVLRFSAALSAPGAGTRGAAGLSLKLPASVSRVFPPAGLPQVEGTINGQPFRAALDPDPAGGHLLRVNKAMAAGAKAAAGDVVELAMLGPEPEPVAPLDLAEALSASASAQAFWQELTAECRRDYIRWVEMAKKAETRERRVLRSVEQLEEGKRRPCCVNFYEYMLLRVKPDQRQAEPDSAFCLQTDPPD
ncbi:DUF1905 domain-containing protein [bacterium]|nr:DUF1905 domain-containing protein [bacterium]